MGSFCFDPVFVRLVRTVFAGFAEVDHGFAEVVVTKPATSPSSPSFCGRDPNGVECVVPCAPAQVSAHGLAGGWPQSHTCVSAPRHAGDDLRPRLVVGSSAERFCSWGGHNHSRRGGELQNGCRVKLVCLLLCKQVGYLSVEVRVDASVGSGFDVLHQGIYVESGYFSELVLGV